MVRAEHDNYFYPDYVVCVRHNPADDPMLRLLETKDAARKAEDGCNCDGFAHPKKRNVTRRLTTGHSFRGASIEAPQVRHAAEPGRFARP